MNNANFQQGIGVQLIRKRGDSKDTTEQINEQFSLGGKFHLEHIRNGQVISRQEVLNGITDEGKKKILNLYFYETDQEIPDGATDGVYIGLIDTGGSLAAADTYVAHAGWSEYTNYKVSTADKRGEWGAGAATGAGTVSIVNAAAIVYDIDGAGGDIYGIFVCSGAILEIEAQSDTTAGNTLWATAALASELAVVSGDQLKITYTVNAA